MRQCYSGIGSRRTPPNVLSKMREFAQLTGKSLLTLRSGAAPGADATFELGCDDVSGPKEIYLPWANFNNHPSRLYKQTPEAREWASKCHKAWDHLRPSHKSLISRNMHQIMGANMDSPSLFVVCWTPDGCESDTTYSKLTGGTGTAIVCASKHNIPVFNFKNRISEDMAYEFLEHHIRQRHSLSIRRDATCSELGGILEKATNAKAS